MNTQPKVSILLPIYGVENYIEKCAVSVFEQTYPNIEVIFVDDCTLDNSVAILEEVLLRYPSMTKKTRILHHDKNRGLAAARNTALDAAGGEFVMFVDSDDYIEPTYVEKMLSTLKQEDADIAICCFRHIGKKQITIEHPLVYVSAFDYIKGVLERRTMLNICGKLYKKNLFEQSQVRFVEGVNYGEDYVVLARLVYSVKRIAYVKFPLYNYIRYNTSSYTYQLRRQSFENLIKAESIVTDYYKDKDIDVENNLILGRLKIKAELLIAYYRGEVSDKSLYQDICHLYKREMSTDNMHALGFQNKLILWLCARNQVVLLKYFIRYGYEIKQWLK